MKLTCIFEDGHPPVARAELTVDDVREAVAAWLAARGLPVKPPLAPSPVEDRDGHLTGDFEAPIDPAALATLPWPLATAPGPATPEGPQALEDEPCSREPIAASGSGSPRPAPAAGSPSESGSRPDSATAS